MLRLASAFKTRARTELTKTKPKKRNKASDTKRNGRGQRALAIKKQRNALDTSRVGNSSSGAYAIWRLPEAAVPDCNPTIITTCLVKMTLCFGRFNRRRDGRESSGPRSEWEKRKNDNKRRHLPQVSAQCVDVNAASPLGAGFLPIGRLIDLPVFRIADSQDWFSITR